MDVACLEPVNFNRLYFGKEYKYNEEDEGIAVPSLVKLSIAKICTASKYACAKAIRTCPSNLAPALLTCAIDQVRMVAIIAFIANWPLETLCVREVLSEMRADAMEEEMYLDLLVFKGVAARTKYCRMQCLDIRGLTVNNSFARLIINKWPMLSLKKSQRNAKRLTQIVLKNADLKKDSNLAKEIIPRIVSEMLHHEQSSDFFDRYSINIPRGKKLEVFLDTLEFSTQETFFMDYLITHCLKAVTPVTVRVANVSIKSELEIGDEIMDSLAPFILFRGHSVETLKGISLTGLEDNVLAVVEKDLTPFTFITALALPNCSVSLRSGRTRTRTSSRHQFTNFLHQFPLLVKLDLSQNSFQGCLAEILSCLNQNLEYLSLKDCNLLDEDIEALAISAHAQSLLYLDLSRICGLFPQDSFSVQTEHLLNQLLKFAHLRILHLEQNQICDTHAQKVCRTMATHWPDLQALNLHDNLLGREKCADLVLACTEAPSMEVIRLPHTHHMAMFVMQIQQREEYLNELEKIAEENGKPHLRIEVQPFAYTILGPM